MENEWMYEAFDAGQKTAWESVKVLVGMITRLIIRFLPLIIIVVSVLAIVIILGLLIERVKKNGFFETFYEIQWKWQEFFKKFK